jgi:hypothetical protein
MNNKIIEIYKEHYSVSEVLRQINVFSEKKISRQNIVTILKNAGIYEGINGENYIKVHRNRVNKVIKDKYGVNNYGTISGGFGESNKIPYRNVKGLTDDFQEYKRAVSRLTIRAIKKLKKPEFCEYTGIKFCDVIGIRSNPNDPRKRSVDHRIPIIICYLNGINIKDAASLDNLAFVLRYVNTIKANTDYNSFLPIATKIREVFINEGFESN